jgi:protein-tyrosine-phosphatase
VARRREVDISTHRSRLLNRTDVREADLIVAMTHKHRETVGILDPGALDYTVLLTDFCDESYEVPDPIGGGIDEYERAYDLIYRCIEELAARLDDYDGWKRTGTN